MVSAVGAAAIAQGPKKKEQRFREGAEPLLREEELEGQSEENDVPTGDRLL